MPIASYELVTSTEILGTILMERMLAGLSTRRYPVGLEPVVATKTCRWWLGQGVHPLAGHGLGEPHAVAGGLADVDVEQESVDGGGGQRFGHELVESCRVKIAR
jgi:hypothetical protein